MDVARCHCLLRLVLCCRFYEILEGQKTEVRCCDLVRITESINQAKHIYIAPCVASESTALERSGKRSGAERGVGAVSGLNEACCSLYSLYSALCSLHLTSVTVIKAHLPNVDNTKFYQLLKSVKSNITNQQSPLSSLTLSTNNQFS